MNGATLEITQTINQVVLQQTVVTIEITPWDAGAGKIPEAIFIAAGDLIVGTGPGTYTRIPAGTGENGKYLKRDTGQASGYSFGDLTSGLSAPFLVQMAGGNLITDGSSGFCDPGEAIKTVNNSQLVRVNKFEKGESGQADLPFMPDIWNAGTVTPYLRQICFDLNVLDNCDAAWTYLTNVTGSNDTSIKVQGTGSVKLAVAAAFTTGLIAHKTITSVDLRNAQYFYFWFRSDVALNAGDWKFMLDDTAACASPIKTYDIPAISTNTWTLVEIPAGDVSGCSAIISIGLQQAVDKGAMNAYIDYVGWTGNVTWGIQAVCVTDTETPDVAFGTAQEYTQTIRYYKETLITFPALTIAGTPAIGERLRVQIYRKNAASDTHGTAKASFVGAKLVCARS